MWVKGLWGPSVSFIALATRHVQLKAWRYRDAACVIQGEEAAGEL